MMYRRARGLSASETGTSTSRTPNPCGCGAARSWVEATALAAGLKIPAASANIMALIERRTFPPLLV